MTAYTGKVEVGQNARTSLTQAVAEELGAPMSSIEMVMGDTERTLTNGHVRQHDHAADGSAASPCGRAPRANCCRPGEWEAIDFAEDRRVV